jgi:hypothetical protein
MFHFLKEKLAGNGPQTSLLIVESKKGQYKNTQDDANVASLVFPTSRSHSSKIVQISLKGSEMTWI